MIRVQCPACKRRYRTITEAIGRTAVCTKCHRTFKIGESRPPFEWKSIDLGEDSWIGVEVPEEQPERKHCIICDAPLRSGEVRCPECGANQITGVVHKRAPVAPVRERSLGNYLPLRAILVFAIIGGIAAGAYLAILMIARSATQTAEQLADESILRDAARYLREGRDEFTFASTFGGRVNDKNLPRFVRRLSAGDVAVRRATALLIGCGTIRSVTPIVDWARQANDTQTVLNVLGAIGARRLVEMSNTSDDAVRRSAAEAMCLLASLPASKESLEKLSVVATTAEKTQAYNELCRQWPEAVGGFQLEVSGTPGSFETSVEQVGRMFYLRLGSGEFASVVQEPRRFVIPVEHYCAATGSAVSAQAVRDLMRGTVTLESPTGVGWEGLIQASMKRALQGPLPGYLPVETPPADGALALQIRLIRSRR